MNHLLEDLVRRVFSASAGTRPGQPAAAPTAGSPRRVMERFLGNRFQLGPLLERLKPRVDSGPRVRVRRPEDLLVFDLLFDNLRIDPDRGEGAQLTREDSNRRGILIVEFPPQSFGEEAFLEASPALDGELSKELPPKSPGPGPTVGKNVPPRPEDLTVPGPLPAARVRMSGPSRVAFSMPAGITHLPFTLDAVLGAMREWPLNLDVNARLDEEYPRYWIVPASYAEELRRSLIGSVRADQRDAVAHALTTGARRIAESASGGLQGTDGSGLGGAVWNAIQQESARMVARHPELGEGDLHTAILGALALDTAIHLSQMTDALQSGPEGRALLERLPYLPLLIGNPHPPSPSVTAPTLNWGRDSQSGIGAY